MTNITLHCFHIADSDKCSFCKTERETLLHLFCTCSSLVLFWENVLSCSLIHNRLICYLVLKKIMTTI